jgi:hypothetical protein
MRFRQTSDRRPVGRVSLALAVLSRGRSRPVQVQREFHFTNSLCNRLLRQAPSIMSCLDGAASCVLKNTICRMFRFDIVLFLALTARSLRCSDSVRLQRHLHRSRGSREVCTYVKCIPPRLAACRPIDAGLSLGNSPRYVRPRGALLEPRCTAEHLPDHGRGSGCPLLLAVAKGDLPADLAELWRIG